MSKSESENPVIPAPVPKGHEPMTNEDWWPDQVNLGVLHQHAAQASPLGEDFDYTEEFKTLDLDALKRDVFDVMTTSQAWWPADYGHYGPFFIRMSWHAAGTYRIEDGRGGGGTGAQRFAPLNSWPDNASLDKARRLLWPIKQKYGQRISWADLIVFAGNCALESMGFSRSSGSGSGERTFGNPTRSTGVQKDTWLEDERYRGDRELANPLGAVQMGLIYVNPEGPNGNPDPLEAARDVRETFARMAMNDEETVALIVWVVTPLVRRTVRPAATMSVLNPRALLSNSRAWAGRTPSEPGRGRTTVITSGLEGAWTSEPTKWDNGFLDNLFNYDWELTTSPAGERSKCGTPKGLTHRAGDGPRCPRSLKATCAHDADDRPRAKSGPDLRADCQALPREPRPALPGLRQGVVQAPPPRHGTRLALPRSVGTRAPAMAGPCARCRPPADRRDGHRRSQGKGPRFGAVGLSACVDRVGGSRQLPWHRQARRSQRGAPPPGTPTELGRSTIPQSLAKVLAALERIQRDFNGAQSEGRNVSLADLIVLGGCAAVEEAAKRAGVDLTVPFAPGRTDASPEQTDVDSFAVLEPRADGFRNYVRAGEKVPADELLVDRSYMLTLTAPEMVVLVAGIRMLNANAGQSPHGVFTDRPETLTNDFFVNLLDMGTEWRASVSSEHVYEGRDRMTGELKWTATVVDLLFQDRTHRASGPR